jgi:hypothetical protein
VRVRLLGQKLWSQRGEQVIYLDGQVFGQPGLRTDNNLRTDVIFRSGSGAPASDFESWFYLGKPPSPLPKPAPPLNPVPGPGGMPIQPS